MLMLMHVHNTRSEAAGPTVATTEFTPRNGQPTFAHAEANIRSHKRGISHSIDLITW